MNPTAGTSRGHAAGRIAIRAIAKTERHEHLGRQGGANPRPAGTQPDADDARRDRQRARHSQEHRLHHPARPGQRILRDRVLAARLLDRPEGIRGRLGAPAGLRHRRRRGTRTRPPDPCTEHHFALRGPRRHRSPLPVQGGPAHAGDPARELDRRPPPVPPDRRRQGLPRLARGRLPARPRRPGHPRSRRADDLPAQPHRRTRPGPRARLRHRRRRRRRRHPGRRRTRIRPHRAQRRHRREPPARRGPLPQPGRRRRQDSRRPRNHRARRDHTQPPCPPAQRPRRSNQRGPPR